MNIFDRLLNPLAILYSLPGILLGLVLHELAHALVADRLGDPTPRRMGRISLNPLHHLDVMGFIMLIVAGFGWAKPVMTDPRNYRTKRFGFALVGIAGPLTNMVLGLILLAVFYLLATQAGVTRDNVFIQIVSAAVYINFMLCAFNILPIPPLDGYNILKDSLLVRFVRPTVLWNMERYGSFALLSLLLLGWITQSLFSFNVVSWYLNTVVTLLIRFGDWFLRPLFGI